MDQKCGPMVNATQLGQDQMGFTAETQSGRHETAEANFLLW